MDSTTRIRNLPKIRKALESARDVRGMQHALSLLIPLLEQRGIEIARLEDATTRVLAAARVVEEMSGLPDEFNSFFAERGWIMDEDLSIVVAGRAVEKARQGCFDDAEQILVDYYNPATVEIKLAFMRDVNAFKPRWALARKALVDYREERYHACVPVVLALLDGMVNEVHEERRGFFAEGTDLTAWDSLTGHSRGLNALAGILRKGRQATTTEPIPVPYRHGILHGMDLGYDNPLVAAKAWAALFATREWAISAERGTLAAPAPEPGKPRSKAIREQVTARERNPAFEDLSGWQPRNLTIGVDLPAAGPPAEYPVGSPERRLAEYLTYWQQGNYGYAARCLHPTHNEARNDPGLVREVLEPMPLHAYRFVDITDTAARTEIETELDVTQFGKRVKKTLRMQLTYIDLEGSVRIRDEQGGEWVVFTWPGL